MFLFTVTGKAVGRALFSKWCGHPQWEEADPVGSGESGNSLVKRPGDRDRDFTVFRYEAPLLRDSDHLLFQIKICTHNVFDFLIPEARHPEKSNVPKSFERP